MAVTKLWSVTERLGQVIDYATNPEKTSANIKREFSPEQYQALADVIAYAKDEEKTEREFYVEGINCNVAIARDQFITVKEQYQKTEGIQAYHGYLSFKETDISPEMAQKIGMEFANEVWGKRFQVVVTTHLNTKHLHCQSRMDRYSAANALLIYSQYPQATQLKDFNDWGKDNVKITKGAKSVSILEPVEYTRADGSPGISYNVKKVFDVTEDFSNFICTQHLHRYRFPHLQENRHRMSARVLSRAIVQFCLKGQSLYLLVLFSLYLLHRRQ